MIMKHVVNKNTSTYILSKPKHINKDKDKYRLKGKVDMQYYFDLSRGLLKVINERGRSLSSLLVL